MSKAKQKTTYANINTAPLSAENKSLLDSAAQAYGVIEAAENTTLNVIVPLVFLAKSYGVVANTRTATKENPTTAKVFREKIISKFGCSDSYAKNICAIVLNKLIQDLGDGAKTPEALLEMFQAKKWYSMRDFRDATAKPPTPNRQTTKDEVKKMNPTEMRSHFDKRNSDLTTTELQDKIKVLRIELASCQAKLDSMQGEKISKAENVTTTKIRQKRAA
jgi:hypothetical protein